MRRIRCFPLTAILLFALPCGAVLAQGQPKAPAGMIVWDTVEPAAQALSPAALAGKNAWSTLAPGSTGDVKGDAVLSNGRIVAVLRRQDAAVEVHAVKPDGAVSRVRLRLQTAAGELAERVERIALIENAKGSAAFEAGKGVRTPFHGKGS